MRIHTRGKQDLQETFVVVFVWNAFFYSSMTIAQNKRVNSCFHVNYSAAH